MISHLSHVARESGKLLRAGLGRVSRIEEKGRATDLVTEFDKASEKLAVSYISEHFPDHGILGEEGSDINPGAEYRWIIDPLDGTTSFAYGIPFFSVSIALQKSGTTIAAAVYEPCHDELFTATRGGGAFLNEEPIRVSDTDTLERSLLATGFPYRIAENPHRVLETFCAIAPRARGIRRLGSAAIDLCYLACGRFDGYWEILLRPWDAAAGVLIVEEAGGRVTDFSGGAYDLWGLETLATNGRIHDELRMRIAEGLGKGEAKP